MEDGLSSPWRKDGGMASGPALVGWVKGSVALEENVVTSGELEGARRKGWNGEEGGSGHLDSWPQSEQALTGSRLHDGLILIMSWLEVCVLEESCAVSMRSHSAFNVRVVQTF